MSPVFVVTPSDIFHGAMIALVVIVFVGLALLERRPPRR